MSKYTIEVIIEGGGDEFWEELEKAGNSGADEIVAHVRAAVEEVFPSDTNVRLIKYEAAP